MHHATLPRLLLLSLTLLIGDLSYAAEPAPSGGKKIIKWQDEQGNTHYGDTLPPQFSKKNTVINSQGVVIKRNVPGEMVQEQTPQMLEQQRRDRALLASFTTAQEIDLARDRHLQMDEITIQGLQQRRVTAVNQLQANTKFADGYKARKKPIPADLVQDIKSNQDEVAHIDVQIKNQQDAISATRQRFDADKQRFLELKASGSSN